MPLIPDSLQAQVKERFSRVVLTDVKLVHFTEYDLSEDSPLVVMRSQGRQFYEETRTLLREVAELSDRVHLEIHDVAADPEGASAYGIDMVPATVLIKGDNSRVRFFGFPSGNQFSALIEAIGDLSRGGVPMAGTTKDALQIIPNPVQLQVFVTPNWPVGPAVARVACQFAITSPKVTADIIEVMEFPELGLKHGVIGSPTTIINEGSRIRGPLSEESLLDQVIKSGAQ